MQDKKKKKTTQNPLLTRAGCSEQPVMYWEVKEQGGSSSITFADSWSSASDCLQLNSSSYVHSGMHTVFSGTHQIFLQQFWIWSLKMLTKTVLWFYIFSLLLFLLADFQVWKQFFFSMNLAKGFLF